MKKNSILLLATFTTLALASEAKKAPNVVVILADDMGYSDISSFGGEIKTKNIDLLAKRGVQFTNFYNSSRSCPTRASLISGLYQHQAGIGWMADDPSPAAAKGNNTKDWGLPNYRGALNSNCVTIAELLKEHGYNTYMAGKWHLGMFSQDRWPLQRGFDKFYGILAGATSYLAPSDGRGLYLGNEKLPVPKQPYYTTDAFTDYALDFISKENNGDNPFFLYLSYNAVHWPLQAKESYIDKFYKLYRTKGWNAIREERYERMVKLGIVNDFCGLAEWENRDWDELSESEKDMTAYRMAVYAAQLYSLDLNVGRVIDQLKKDGELDNTLIFFLSDNGACAEPSTNELGGGKQSDINNPKMWGKMSYGRAWAQVSNTPFRKYKQHPYEGGIATPLIVSWSGTIEPDKEFLKTASFLPDIMATIVDATGATYPKEYKGEAIHPLVGKSLMPVIDRKVDSIHEYIFFEHEGHRAVRKGDWKAAMDTEVGKWELFNLATDRAEKYDVAAVEPKVIKELSQKWDEWAAENNVILNFHEVKLEKFGK